MVSHNTSKFSPRTFSSAVFTTPGPLTPTLITASASVTPWNAPAINGLSSGALQNTTSFIQSTESLSLDCSATSKRISPINFTASMLIPVFVDARFTELQTLSVRQSAIGIERIKSSSAFVIPLDTNAEYPPIRFTPTALAAASIVSAMVAKSSGVLQAAPPTSAIGVTEILLFTIGIPNSCSI